MNIRKPNHQTASSTSSNKPPERAPVFHELTYDLPIAGTPAPLPCPFCGSVEMVGITIGGNEYGPTARAECSGCGVEMCPISVDKDTGLVSVLDLVLEACKLWNSRPRAKAVQS